MPAAVAALIAWVGAKMAGGVAGIAALIAVITALTAALYALIASTLTLIAITFPPEFGLAIGLMPSNVPLCLEALVIARVARWGYDIHVDMAKTAAYAKNWVT